MNATYVTAACMSAFFTGVCAALAGVSHHVHVLRSKALKEAWQGSNSAVAQAAGLSGIILNRVLRFDAGYRPAPLPAVLERVALIGQGKLEKALLYAGLGDVRVQAAALWRIKAGITCASVLGLFGAALSPFAAILFFIGGIALGYASLNWALYTAKGERVYQLESHLSEAIEVLCLGLRAGLSFERSLALYCTNFESHLAQEFARTQQVWGTGLLTREEALRSLAASYDSSLFGRMIESILRSLRFGSPLAESLEELAQEARNAHRARVEEKVMKAPVKMMLPIGIFILPSMLLLVMGPIMLELIEGF